MSKQFCTWVELNPKGVNELLNDCEDVVKATAYSYAQTLGSSSHVEMGTRSKRPIAFVSLPYKEASKNNNFLKKMFGKKK